MITGISFFIGDNHVGALIIRIKLFHRSRILIELTPCSNGTLSWWEEVIQKIRIMHVVNHQNWRRTKEEFSTSIQGIQKDSDSVQLPRKGQGPNRRRRTPIDLNTYPLQRDQAQPFPSFSRTPPVILIHKYCPEPGYSQISPAGSNPVIP